MENRNRGDDVVKGRELIAEGADLRVTIMILDAGQCVPWHWHSAISDDIVCLDGPMVVETRAPRHEPMLQPGERCTIAPKTAHSVHGKDGGPCRFLTVRGLGFMISW